ncbi:hypothetical protein BGZ98_009966 [Dissophora globulifera]|nr:hypothetical protein BGZ98_009966 [Dissophora globulifera]
MNTINRTTLILDHSPLARRRACDDAAKEGGIAGDDSDDEFDLEPCSMWSSFIHASLHYSRLAWDLSPAGQNSQISVHAAPGPPLTRNSAILNTWTAQEQTLAFISSSIQEVQDMDDTDQKIGHEGAEDVHDWIGPSLLGAISHILEPASLQQPMISTGHASTTPAIPTGALQAGINAKIILLLVDPDDDQRNDSEDIQMGNAAQDDRSWRYGDQDLRQLLTDALHRLHDYIKASKVINIHVDYIRATTHRTRIHADIVDEDISKICTASVYTVVIEDENSAASALINHYLIHNRDVQLLRLHNVPLKHHNKGSPVDLYYRSDHIRRLSKTKALEREQEDESARILQNTPWSVRDVTELDYGDFVEVIVRPNTITSSGDAYRHEDNTLTEIAPFALKPTATFQVDNEDVGDQRVEDAQSSSLGVNMALVHTTSKLDLETRWLVQWEGERIHPIMPVHSVQIQKFRSAICRSNVDSAGLATISAVLDALIPDARPLVLPGEVPLGPIPPQQHRFRDSAQAILADLWMIGQRFKSVSESHVKAASLIATKITPKGLDHQTVKLTLVTPNRRVSQLNSDATGASPAVDGGDVGGDGWNRNKGPRGGGNMGGGSGRGRGNRFDGNRGGRGGGGVGGGGPGGRGRGGFRGGNNAGGGGANADESNFGAGGSSAQSPLGPNGDIMVSMTGKTQPTPYLVTQPPTREEIEESEQEYLAQLGEDGCLLKAYWGSRGAQGSSIAAVLNSVTSLDSPSAALANGSNMSPTTGMAVDHLTAVAVAAQQKMKKLATKRPRLQDFAGRTPAYENGGFSRAGDMS